MVSFYLTRALPLLLALACVCAPVRAQRLNAPPAPGPLPHAWDELAYNRRAWIACHNCYEPQFLSLALAMDSTQAVEVDIWRATKHGAWSVGHGDFVSEKLDAGLAKSHSTCDDRKHAAGDLARCLTRVGEHLRRNAGGDVLTVYLDLKNSFGGKWSPDALDALIRAQVDRALIVTPEDLATRRYGTAPAAGGLPWPALGALHGRVIFVLTGPDARTSAYRVGGGRRLAFVARNVETPEEMNGLVRKDPEESRFVNVGVKWTLGAAAFAERLRAAERAARLSRVARLWYVHTSLQPDKADVKMRKEAACAFLGTNVHFVAMYRDFKRIQPRECQP